MSVISDVDTTRDLADENARLRAELAAEKIKSSRAKSKAVRDAQRKKPKVILSPWDDPLIVKIVARSISPATLIALAKSAVAEHTIDAGPTPDGLHGVAQKGSVNLPRLVIESWVRRSIDALGIDHGIVAAAEKIEQKLDATMLLAREHVVRAFRVALYIHLVDVHRDEERARSEFARHDLVTFDPDAINPEPVATSYGPPPIIDADGEEVQ